MQNTRVHKISRHHLQMCCLRSTLEGRPRVPNSAMTVREILMEPQVRLRWLKQSLGIRFHSPGKSEARRWHAQGGSNPLLTVDKSPLHQRRQGTGRVTRYRKLTCDPGASAFPHKFSNLSQSKSGIMQFIESTTATSGQIQGTLWHGREHLPGAWAREPDWRAYRL